MCGESRSNESLLVSEPIRGIKNKPHLQVYKKRGRVFLNADISETMQHTFILVPMYCLTRLSGATELILEGFVYFGRKDFDCYGATLNRELLTNGRLRPYLKASGYG